MANVANAEVDDPLITPRLLAPGGGERPQTDTLRYGPTVRALLATSSLAGVRVLAGAGGLHRMVHRVSLFTGPGRQPGTREPRAHELLVAAGPSAGPEHRLADLVSELDANGCAGLAVSHESASALPEPMLRAADRHGLPLLRVPGGSPVEHVALFGQVLADVLVAQTVELTRADEIYNCLLRGVLTCGGFGELVSGLARLLGCAALMIGSDGRVLASAGSPEEVAAAHAAVGAESPHRLAPPDDTRSQRWLTAAVLTGPTPHSHLVAFRSSGGWCPGDQRHVERAAVVAALVEAGQRAVAASEHRHRADFLRDLLDGRIRDPERVMTRAATLGWDLERALVVLVAVLNPPPGTDHPDRAPRAVHDAFVTAWAAAVRERDPHAAVAGFIDEAVALVAADSAEAVANRAADAVSVMSTALMGWTSSVGLSRGTALRALPDAYSQAGRAARIGRRLRTDAAVTRFDELGAFRLLSLIPDSDEVTSYVTEILGELVSDTPDAADLRHTLRVLLDTNLNVAEAARQLHFHYNTLRYRISRLGRLVGPFMTDSNLRLNLQLALHVEQLRGR